MTSADALAALDRLHRAIGSGCDPEGIASLVPELKDYISGVAMAEGELVGAARAVVAADTYVTPGKTRFEATSEAIARLEALLPIETAKCAKSKNEQE